MAEEKKNVAADPRLFIATKTPTGYTWTLASRLGEMLRDAQELFGPRDMSYTILGVEFVSGIPQCWYPGDCKNIAIQLNILAVASLSQACFQLSHEAVHLLSPTGGNHANLLEEGLAVWFSQHYMRTRLKEPHWRPTVQSYIRAVELIGPHLDRDAASIRRLRESQPLISAITAEELRSEFVELSEDEAEFLVQPFVRGQ